MRLSRFIVVILVGLAMPLSLASVSLAQAVRTLYNFDGSVGSSPADIALTQGRDGQLYGTTVYGGTDGLGVTFKITTAGHITELHSFSGTDGKYPRSGLTLGTDGNFYGTTEEGGTGIGGAGVLFKMSPSGILTVLHNFNNNGADGASPFSPPIMGSDGSLYGATGYGGTGSGTVYKFTPPGTLAIIYDCDEGSCDSMYFSPTQGSNGNLYIAANGEFDNNCGSLLEMSTSGVLINSYFFDCGSDGGNPGGSLRQDPAGNFFGTAVKGGAYSGGVLFELTTSFGLAVVHSFGEGATDGTFPGGGVIQAANGKFYGVDNSGGIFSDGTIYSYALGGAYSTLFPWGSAVNAGGTLVQHTNGALYGATSEGGTDNLGTVYSLSPGLGPFVTFVLPAGRVDQTAQILGQGLTGTTAVTFNGVAATKFTVVSDTYMTAVVPSGATTGSVVVTTPGGALTSNVSFRIIN
jgi:uncharacterized repeat protein (TIGR03803 family)